MKEGVIMSFCFASKSEIQNIKHSTFNFKLNCKVNSQLPHSIKLIHTAN